MRSMFRQFKRAPGRIVASIFALALALGAVGVMAVPTVSEGALHAATARDGLAAITLATTPIAGTTASDAVAHITGVAHVDREVDVAGTLASANGNARDVRIVGLEFADQQLDLLQLRAGRLPQAPNEAVVADGVANVGDTIDVQHGNAATASMQVVGIGNTLWWRSVDVIFGDVDAITASFQLDGANRLVIKPTHDDEAALQRITAEAQTTLAQHNVTLTDLPITFANGTTPIDADIRQVSKMIGLLGSVAGIVALVLLGSTTNTLIAERTREVLVMRALGARTRPLRRRLRNIATAIAAAALVVGLPLGALISYGIARLVLVKFVGITPAFVVSWPTIAASAIAALVGAQLVSARAARRATAMPLAESLRDRDAAPFGRRALDRSVAKLPFGALRSRLALRASMHRRARALSIVAQIAAGVAATVIIATVATSINDYNAAVRTPWSWETRMITSDPGLPIPVSVEDGAAGDEAGIWMFAKLERADSDLDVELYGLRDNTAVFDPLLRAGRWIAPAQHEAVMSAGFARFRHLQVGDDVDVALPTGIERYRIVGLANDHGRALYVDRADLANDLGLPGYANLLWSTRANPTIDIAGPVDISTADEVAAEDSQGRKALTLIFAIIGLIVAGVATLATIATVSVGLFERRHELAMMQALGASRRRLRSLVARELLPLGALGLALGIAGGWWGSARIVESFESFNQIDIGMSFAVHTIPYLVVGTGVLLLLIARRAVRNANRRPVAELLRGAV